MAPIIKLSIEDIVLFFESWDAESHPKTRPFILSEKERNTGFEPFDLARLKCYYAALQLCPSEHYSSEIIKSTLESPLTAVSKILVDAWRALRTGTNQTVKIIDLLMKLFPCTPAVNADILHELFYKEVKRQMVWDHVDYGLETFCQCLGYSDVTVEYCSCYVAILAKKRLPEHEFVKACDEKSIFLKLISQHTSQLENALHSEEDLLDLFKSVAH